VGGTAHLGMNSKAHSENPLKRVKEIFEVEEIFEVKEIFEVFSLTLYGFEL
jgi:hypothetical protein